MKKTRLISIITAALLFVAVTSDTILAYSGGSGTLVAPYQIANSTDLLQLAGDTGNYDKYFILTANIDLSGHVFTAAVIAPDTNETDPGFQGITFTGVFYGNGHIIGNLTINNTNAGNSCLGLFGELEGGEIDDLRLINVTITSGDSSSEIGGLVGENRGLIGHCSSTGTITVGNASSQIGGLVGYSAFGAISNCYSICDITGGNNASQLGGLAGCSWGGSISDSYSMGNITSGDNSDSLGGLIGENMMSSVIINSFATGNVVGGFDSQTVGGLVGYNNMSGAISSCYATGVAAGTNTVGGLMGYNWGDLSNCYATGAVTGTSNVGGLAGYYNYGSTSNCYSTGNVSGTSDTGGLLGHFAGGSISHCYFLDTSGPGNGLGTALTNAKMKQQASFVGWDFVGETVNGTEDIWLINEGVDYPKLNLPTIASVVVKFGSFHGWKNVKQILTDCDGNSVTFSLTGGGYGEIDPTDCAFSTIMLFDTTDKSALTISTKGKAWTKVGSIICNGPMKSITAKTTELSGSMKIGSSSKPKAAVKIVFDRSDTLNIDSNMPIKSISTSDWWGGSLVAPSIGSITTTAKTTPKRYGNLQPDVTVTGVINSVKVVRQIAGSWDCNSIKSITAPWLGSFYLTLSQKPDAKIPSLGTITAKNGIHFSQILSRGNIGTVNAGSLLYSNLFAGVADACLVDVNAADGILDLPPALDDTFDETATIKSIAIKGINGEPNCVANSNIAAANILSASLAYPLTANGGVTFGIAADYIKTLTIKGKAGSKTYKDLDESTDSKVFDNLEIRLY